jgi:hypothetical protein
MADKWKMAALATAFSRFFSAQLRRVGFRRDYPGWHRRAAICEQCPMRVIRCGVSYCGKPFLQQIDRDPATEGCGCPCWDKAKTPDEHCPIDSRNQPAQTHDGNCSCKWCRSVALGTL